MCQRPVFSGREDHDDISAPSFSWQSVCGKSPGLKNKIFCTEICLKVGKVGTFWSFYFLPRLVLTQACHPLSLVRFLRVTLFSIFSLWRWKNMHNFLSENNRSLIVIKKKKKFLHTLQIIFIFSQRMGDIFYAHDFFLHLH